MATRDLRNYPSRHPPFWTGKLWIGAAFVPKPIPIEGDAVRLQSALLDPRTVRHEPLGRRFFNALRSALT